jgi:hypothetical protein
VIAVIVRLDYVYRTVVHKNILIIKFLQQTNFTEMSIFSLRKYGTF